MLEWWNDGIAEYRSIPAGGPFQRPIGFVFPCRSSVALFLSSLSPSTCLSVVWDQIGFVWRQSPVRSDAARRSCPCGASHPHRSGLGQLALFVQPLFNRLPTTALLALFFRGHSRVPLAATRYPHGTYPSFGLPPNWVRLAQKSQARGRVEIRRPLSPDP